MERGEVDGLGPSADTSGGAGAQHPGRRLIPFRTENRRILATGVFLVLLAAGVLAANLGLPILAFTVAGAEVASGWGDLREPGGLAYEQRLLVWPLAACVLVAVAGSLLAVRAYLQPRQGGWVRSVETPLPWLLAYSGFLLALTGTRWLGFFLARRSEADVELVRLHTVPYLNLTVGFLVLVGAGWSLARQARHGRGPRRWAAWSAAAASSGLLLLPLLPFGHWSFGGGGVVRLDEFTLAALAAQGSTAPEALGWARLMAWGALYTSVAACLAWQVPPGAAPRLTAWLCRLGAVNILFVVAGGMFLVRFHAHLPDLRRGVVAEPNLFLHATLLALGVLWWFQVRSLAGRQV